MTIAQELQRRAHELAANDDNLYRVRAYRQAAAAILRLERPVRELLAERGIRGLRSLPSVGPSLAKTIAELVDHELAGSS